MQKVFLIGILGWALAGASGFVGGCDRPKPSLPERPAALPKAPPAPVEITYPFDGALFPPESLPPTFTWTSKANPEKGWRLRAAFKEGEPFETVVDEREWTPDEKTWAAFKTRSTGNPAEVTVEAVLASSAKQETGKGHILFETSTDPVDAPLFYREVPLPFIDAVKDPAQIRWRFGGIDEKPLPKVVLTNLPVCGNCHSFSADGKVLGMDVDYANDKGSYAITETSSNIILDKSKVITWSDYRREDGQQTFGLLSQVSPDGRYAVSTVKDRSVFVPKEDLAFSQLFFPLQGILAVYDRKTGKFEALPGADDPTYVHSNPTWSPDGKYIVFARAKAYKLKHLTENAQALLTPKECQEFLEGGKLFRFDLYRIPFNDGKGGDAVPLKGASGNGRSNYFAKYSPDGKWIVFCRANSFMLLQPDSALYIIPAEGGEARRLTANLGRMNSWHSFSPNGKWLVFSSKPDTPYTQLFLTHIDGAGNSTPPVSLAHLSMPNRAANIPEFVNLQKDAITSIHGTFVDDKSFMRTAGENSRNGDMRGAAKFFREALAVNPRNAEAHAFLGGILLNNEQFEEAREHLDAALKINPKNGEAYFNLGVIEATEHHYDEALKRWKKAVAVAPDFIQAYNNMSLVLVTLGREKEAEEVMKRGVAANPKSAEARSNLGRLYFSLGRRDEAIKAWQEATTLDDMYIDAHQLLSDRMLEDKKYAEALPHLKAVLRVRTGDTQSLMSLALCYEKTGDKQSAIETLGRALSLAKEDGDEELQKECLRRVREIGQ